MKVPYSRYAYVKNSKIVDYLISLTHSVGKHKARIFRSRGFNDNNTLLLKKGLLKIIHTKQYLNKVKTTFGINYVVIGYLKAPDGSIINLRTIWDVKTGKRSPSFTTGYPV